MEEVKSYPQFCKQVLNRTKFRCNPFVGSDLSNLNPITIAFETMQLVCDNAQCQYLFCDVPLHMINIWQIYSPIHDKKYSMHTLLQP